MASVVILVAAPAVHADSIFVNKQSTAGYEDGSQQAPFRTITRALALARSIRFGDVERPPSSRMINVHVAAGEYIGSYDPAVSNPLSPSYDPSMETLPLLVNVPQMQMIGETVLLLDDEGRPLSVFPAGATILRATTRQGPRQHLVVITRTLPKAGTVFPASLEMAGDSVRIAGFTFDGRASDGTLPTPLNLSTLVFVDGVRDFRIDGCLLTRASSFGITARLSSGRIQQNLVADGGVGLNLTGGSHRFPASIAVLSNRVVGNSRGGMGLNGAAQTENDRLDLLDAHQFKRDSLPQFYSPSDHPEEIPDTIDVHVENNIIVNGFFGIRIDGYIRDQYRLAPNDPSPIRANVYATFTSNQISATSFFAVVVDGGQIPALDPRKHVVNIDASFQQTSIQSPGVAPAIFTFWRYAAAVDAVEAASTMFKFAQDSTFRIRGDLASFAYDNRLIDPVTLSPTNNTLIVNGVPLFGTCVPLTGCLWVQ
jgi:hypothetical protein